MRLKSELYSKEQEELSSKIISILDLDPEEHCTTLYELDNNGAKNIYKIAFNSINGKDRPNYLSRKRNLSGIFDDMSKPKFTRRETVKPFGIKIPLKPAF